MLVPDLIGIHWNYSETPFDSEVEFQNFFSACIVNKWNTLPQDVLDRSSVHSFNNRLDQYNYSLLCDNV